MRRELMPVAAMTTIDNACDDAVCRVNSVDFDAEDELYFHFNSHMITARPGCTVRDLLDQWDRGRLEQAQRDGERQVVANPDCYKCKGSGILSPQGSAASLCTCLRAVRVNTIAGKF